MPRLKYLKGWHRKDAAPQWRHLPCEGGCGKDIPAIWSVKRWWCPECYDYRRFPDQTITVSMPKE